MADYGAAAAISLSHGRHGGGGDLSPTSDNDSSDHSPGRAAKPLRRPTSSSPPAAAVSSAEGPKKPRGRPPGSKNKPKPPIVITKDVSDGTAMRPVVLEISAGSDVVESVVQFARRRRVGITVLSGSGSVSNVTLRHPMSHAPALSLHGPFSLLSLYGSFVAAANTTTTAAADTTPSSSSSSPPPTSSVAKPSFGICLAGAQGQVFGGIVGGKVTAASLVVVVAATFANPAFHRLPLPDHHHDEVDHHDHPHTHHHHHHHQESKPGVGEAAGSTSGGGGGSMSSAVIYNTSGVASPTPINCQLSPPDHHAMPSWGHSTRSPY